MKDLLIVGNGFLGGILHKNAIQLGLDSNISDYKKSGIDVRNISSIEEILKQEEPKVVINCSAISNVDAIEKDATNAIAVNANGAKNLATICNKLNLKLIYISTDSVFDGKQKMYSEEDITNPINEYAKSKKLGEDFVKKSLNEHVIVRTNFYGKDSKKKNLFEWVINQLKNQDKIIGFEDVFFNPLEVNNLSKLIIELSQTNFLGTLHLANNEIFSKYQFCKTIAECLGFGTNIIQKGSINEVNLNALRPLNTTLSNKLSTKILKTKLITLKEYLNEYET